MNPRSAVLVLVLLGARAQSGNDPAEDLLLLTRAHLLPVSGAEIPSGSILVGGGKIRAIGEQLDAPPGATVVDLGGRRVIPGLIDAASTLGIAGSSSEDGREVAPEVRVVDSLDPESPALSRARQSGVTAAFIEPGNRGVIGGIASVIKTAGPSRSALILRREAALKGALGPAPAQGNFAPRGAAASFFARRPTTRMGVAWEFRKAFFDARAAGDAPKDPAAMILQKALDGVFPVRISASRQTDLETALEISRELGLAISLEEAQESVRLASTLKSRGIPVLLRPALDAAPDGPVEAGEPRPHAFLQLSRAGVKTALLPLDPEAPENLLASVAFAVRFGARPDEALRSVTLVPAEILGVADRVGSLEVGKDADLVVLSGDPAEITTRVEKVMIGGRWVYGDKSK